MAWFVHNNTSQNVMYRERKALGKMIGILIRKGSFLCTLLTGGRQQRGKYRRKETIENMTMKELESCIEAYGKDIYTFCLHLAGNKELADDLYQDTFLTALEGMERIDKEANTKSYLLSISIRIWKNTKRKW